MSLPIKIICLILSNLVGSFSAAFLFILALKFNLIQTDEAQLGASAQFLKDFQIRVMMTWAVCGLFSFAVFFTKGMWQTIFVLAPALLPILYGLILLSTLQ